MADVNEKRSSDVLLMFSGGRDSFLSACYLIEHGHRVHMITFNNGCMSGENSVADVARRVIEKYGESRATFVGIHSVAANLYKLQKDYLYKQIKDTSDKYPALRPAQLPCLACHTAMYLESIAYCKTHKIRYLAEGARESQKFFVELPEMVERYRELTSKNGIDLLLPVYDLVSDWDRKLELADRGFIPKTLEPQCWIGCPLGEELSREEIDSLAAFYDASMRPNLQSFIDAKVKARTFNGEPVRLDHNEI